MLTPDERLAARALGGTLTLLARLAMFGVYVFLAAVSLLLGVLWWLNGGLRIGH